VTTQLITLLTGMTANSFVRLTDHGEASSLANALPRTRANFDAGVTLGNATWASDAAVNQAPSAGGVGLTTTPAMRAFSGCAISERDGLCAVQGGGHTDNGDGSIYAFNPEDGAASRNGGGSGGFWQLKKKSGMYRDANKFAAPVGSSQTAVTTPTGNNQSYWIDKNADGVMMPATSHSYHAQKFMPGTHTMLLGGNFGFDSLGGGTIGAPWAYNVDTDTLTGPLSPTFLDTSDGIIDSVGYGQFASSASSGSPCSVVPWGPDGTVYAACGGSFGWFVVLWTDPLNKGAGITVDVAPNSTGSPPFENSIDIFGPQVDGIVIADPATAGDLVYFQHGRNGAGGYADSDFLLVRGLKGLAVPDISSHAYVSGTITTQGSSTALAHCYDSKRGQIVFFDGTQLCAVAPTASITGWIVAALSASATGDTPSLPSGTNVPSLNYVPSADAYVLENQGVVWVYKPAGWSLPTPFPWQYWGLDAWTAVASGTAHSLSLSVTSGSAALLAKGVAKVMRAVAANAASAARAVAKALSLGESGIAALGAVKARLVTLAAGMASAIVLLHSIGKSLVVAAGSTGLLARAVNKSLALAAGESVALSAIKARLLALSGTATSAASLSRAMAKVLPAAAASAAGLLRPATRHLAISAQISSVLSLTLAFASNVVANPARTLARFVRRALGFVVTSARSLAASPPQRRSLAPEAAPARALAPQQPPTRQV
jgi:hypothetical protein